MRPNTTRMTAEQLIKKLEQFGGMAGYARARACSKQRVHQFFKRYAPGYVEVRVDPTPCCVPECLNPRDTYSDGNKAEYCARHRVTETRTVCATPWCKSRRGRTVQMCRRCQLLLGARRHQGWVGTREEILAIPPVKPGRPNPGSLKPKAQRLESEARRA